MKTLLVAVLSFLLMDGLVHAQSSPATRPWGKVEQGIRTSATLHPAVPADHLRVTLVAEQQTTEAINLEGAYVWLFVAQGREKAFFTAKVSPSDLPAKLEVGATVTITSEFSAAKAFAHRNDLVVKDGYPQLEVEPKAAGTMGQVLAAGRWRGRVMLYVPARKALVASNTIEIAVGDVDVADILAGFSKDPVAAKDAHDRALKLGGKIVPDVVKLLANKDLPWFGQMWVAATLTDSGDARAVPALVAAVNRGGATAQVIAYHGFKLKSQALGEAVDLAATKDPVLAAWAARGSQEFTKTRRPDLIDAAIQALSTAKDKERTTLVECLEKATGQKFGTDAAKWQAWWKDHRDAYAKGK